MSYFKHDHALVHENAKIGSGTRIWAHTNIQDGAEIGTECNICDGSYVEKGAVIGNHVTIKHHVAIFEGVTIEDDVFVGSNVAFINDRYPRSKRSDDWVFEKILVSKGATIGSNCTIVCGVTIGPYAVIGAGSIITKNVPAHTIMYGHPSEMRGYACFCGRRINLDLKCTCGMKFSNKGQGLEIDE